MVVATRRFSRRVHMTDEQKKALGREMKQYGREMDQRMIKVFRRMAGEDDHLDVRVPGFDLAQGFESAEPRHPHVEHDDVRAACILTVSDTLSEEESSDETYLPLDALEQATDRMIEVALEAGLSI